MRVLFDQGTPVPLRRSLAAHTVETAYERKWSTLENGALLDAAEQNGFEVLVTTDLNLKHQQNFRDRMIAVVALTTPSWPRIKQVVEIVASTIGTAAPGSYSEVEIP